MWAGAEFARDPERGGGFKSGGTISSSKIALCDIYSKELKTSVHMKTCTWMFIPALLFCSNFLDVFIYLIVAVLGLCCCTWAFSSCGGLLSSSSAHASHCGDFSCLEVWALGSEASVVAAAQD